MFSALPRFAFLRSPSPLHPSTPAAAPHPRRRRCAVALATISSGGPTQGVPPESSASAPVSSSSSLEVLGGANHALLSDPGGPVLHLRPYDPFPVIGWNRHVETIFAAFFRSVPDVRLRRKCLRTVDGGAVALDWVCDDDRLLPADAPLVILLPGLTGGSGDSYVRHMLVRARSRGWRVVVFNSRGCADSPVTTPQFYSASFTRDLSEVVNHVSSCYPKSKVYVVGWSLGANILVRYLGQKVYGGKGSSEEAQMDGKYAVLDYLHDSDTTFEKRRICMKCSGAIRKELGFTPTFEESQHCPISGAVSLCNPFNLVIADEDFHKGFNNVYDKALARALCRILKKHALLFEDIGGEYDIPLAASAKSVRDFDEGLTRVSFGFKSVDDYYFNSSSSDSIKNVRTPLLCIQAANDPIAPSRGIPRDEIQENPYCLLIVTPQGGHLGWLAGSEAPFGAPWTDSVVMDFLELLQAGKSRIPTGDLVDSMDHLERGTIDRGDLADGIPQSATSYSTYTVT